MNESVEREKKRYKAEQILFWVKVKERKENEKQKELIIKNTRRENIKILQTRPLKRKEEPEKIERDLVVFFSS